MTKKPKKNINVRINTKEKEQKENNSVKIFLKSISINVYFSKNVYSGSSGLNL